MSLMLLEPEALISPADGLAVEPLGLDQGLLGLDLLLGFGPTEPAFVEAARELEAATPDSPAAVARLAQAELAAGNTDNARAVADRGATLALDAGDSAVGIAIVQVLAALGATREASDLLWKLPEGGGRSLLAARLAVQERDYVTAMECLKTSDSSEAHAALAWLAIQRKDYPAAISELRTALKLGVPAANILINLGYAYAALGMLERAVKTTLEARYLEPTNRHVSLNLATYLRALGRDEEEAAVIRELRDLYPEDVQFVFVEADFRLWQNDAAGALKTLTRARTSELWTKADLLSRAELEANLALLRWRVGKVSRSDAFEEVTRQLERTEFESIEIGRMLANLAHHPSDADVLDAALAALGERHPDVVLDEIVVQRHLLRLEFEEATSAAVRWANEEIFDASAAATAVYLLVDVSGDFQHALKIGRVALRRAPRSRQLVNNVAYALALAGELREARDLLGPGRRDDVHVTATRALVSMLEGEIEEGNAGYERARELALQEGNEELAALVEYHRVVYEAKALRQQSDTPNRRLVLVVPGDWENSPQLALLIMIARREGFDINVDEPEASLT